MGISTILGIVLGKALVGSQCALVIPGELVQRADEVACALIVALVQAQEGFILGDRLWEAAGAPIDQANPCRARM